MAKKLHDANQQQGRRLDTDTTSFDQQHGSVDPAAESTKPQAKLPHERDESAAATGNRKDQSAAPSEQQISKAHDDVEAGRVDTDRRGTPSDVPRGGR